MLFNIAWHSLRHRKVTVLLTLFSIAVSVMIVLSIEHIRLETKRSFTSTLSSTDLIVGARAGRINLLLYSVFRIGNPTNNISWESYQTISQLKGVSWTIPISLGDAHQSYRVLGTTKDYFTHYRYGQKQSLVFTKGSVFTGVYEAVLGSEVARQLNYDLEKNIILSHGIANVSFTQHDDKPFTVVGILKPTGTPVDQTIHISLAGMEAIHIDWQNGVPIHTGNGSLKISAEEALKHDLTPKTITAFLLGLDNRMMTFRLQRQINNYSKEALMAILPGVALSELWQTMNLAEKVLSLVASLVVVSSLLGMITIILSTLRQRQREIAVLRAIGASPWFIFCLIEVEVFMTTFGGILLGLLLLWASLIIAQPFITDYYGLFIDTLPFTLSTLTYCGIIILVALVLAFIPATLAYRQALGKGLELN
jgi:putative ABC transport system permease protein